MTTPQSPKEALPGSGQPKIYCTGFPGDEEAWCLWWHNPWSGEPEKIAYFLWPAHPAELEAQQRYWEEPAPPSGQKDE